MNTLITMHDAHDISGRLKKRITFTNLLAWI